MSQSTTHRSKDALAPLWYEARQRIVAAASPRFDAFLELAALVDQGGAEIQKLQALYDRNPRSISRKDAWSHLLDFIDADLTDLMRGVSLDAAALVRFEVSVEDADPVETAGDVDLLVRYLGVAALAAEDEVVPEHARDVFREVAGAMSNWGERVNACVTEIATIVLEPIRGMAHAG